MIYFIGKQFLTLDNDNISLADYVSSELAMDFLVLNKVDELKRIKKFSLVISNVQDEEILNTIFYKSKERESYSINYPNEIHDIIQDSYNILDQILATKVEDYEKLLKVYDFLQDEVYYNIYDDLFDKYLTDGNFLELGAGSGLVTKKLVKYKLNILATDLSQKFLLELESKNLGVKTKQLDITKMAMLEKKNNYKYVGMFLDTLNYIDPKYLDSVFLEVANVLEDKGVFLFDIHKEEKMDLFDGYVEEVDFDEFKFHWLSQRVGEHEVTHSFLFINDLLSTEYHTQHIYSVEYYQKIYTKYFKELSIKDGNDRWIIVLEKLK